VKIVYEKETKKVSINKDTFVNCDFKVHNFVTIFNNARKNLFIINCKIIKNI